MRYEDIMMQYNRCRDTERENECVKAAIYTAQILEMVAVERLEKSLKTPPGSNAPKEYAKACRMLAEWTGQTIEETDRRIKEIRERINAAPIDRRPRDKKGCVCKGEVDVSGRGFPRSGGRAMLNEKRRDI